MSIIIRDQTTSYISPQAPETKNNIKINQFIP